MNRTILGPSIGLAAASLLSVSVHAQVLDLVGQFDSGIGEGTEVISVQGSTARMALTNSETGTISILDLSDPAAPTLIGAAFDIGLVPGEGINGVAFHPTEDYFIVAIQVTGAATGRAELRSASTGALLNTLTTGSEPDAVAIDKQGRRAVVSDEGESFTLNTTTGEFESPAGSVTMIDLRNGAAAATATIVALPDATGTPGMVAAADNRFLEREVDVNGNGVIDEDPVDFNGDGDTDDTVVVGTIDGVPVEAEEGDGEILLIPIVNNSPKYLEPEIGAFSKNGKIVYVAMQENNGVAVIDAINNAFVGYVGLGITTHAADISDDGFIDFSETLVALREPDGIAVTRDGRYLVTADEGDSDPKASKTISGYPTAGGRTVSVFDVETGLFLGDTGNQLDQAAADACLYPDGRSDSKGAEPENLVTFKFHGDAYAAVGLERADAVALVSLEDPANPVVVSVAAVNPGTALGGQAPEGIAFLKRDGSHFVYLANEKSGVVSVFEVTRF